MANRGTSVDGGWKLVSFGLCVFSGSFGVRSIVLCKCSGKYIDIYFVLKITFYLDVRKGEKIFNENGEYFYRWDATDAIPCACARYNFLK